MTRIKWARDFECLYGILGLFSMCFLVVASGSTNHRKTTKNMTSNSLGIGLDVFVNAAEVAVAMFAFFFVGTVFALVLIPTAFPPLC